MRTCSPLATMNDAVLLTLDRRIAPSDKAGRAVEVITP